VTALPNPQYPQRKYPGLYEQVTTSAFRGFGNPQITFAVESLLDQLRRDCMDAWNCACEMPPKRGRNAHGFKYVSCGLKTV